jgi:fatty-acyl-CoA synthase
MNEPRGVLASLEQKVGEEPGLVALHAVDPDGSAAILTYRQLYDAALRVGAGLLDRGITPGERVIVSLPTCADFFCVYLGCLLTGIVPAVVAPPRMAPGPGDTTGIASATRTLGARWVIVRELHDGLTAGALALEAITARSLVEHPRTQAAHAHDGDATAHLQGTSGTTSTPRWAIVRHRNITANVAAIAHVVGHREDDVLVTWLPMSHDMGLIGVSYAWYRGIPVVAADPANFIRNPLSWLELISRHGGTLSPAPNSAFQACARVAKLRPPKHLDLARWRVALCGAEPVHAATLSDFHQAFGRFGLRRETLRPVYGLAEATLAVTLSPATRPFHVDRIDASSCASGTTIRAAGERREREIAMVGCGRVIPGHELRIVDGAGHDVGDGVVGEIEFRGASVVDGYFGIDGGGSLVRDGFLRTGDLGYLRDGELFVTGRSKEILIVNGRNFSPLQIEATLERALGASFTPAVVAVEVPDEQLRSGALHLLLDGRIGSGVEARVRQTLEDAFGLRGVSLHWVAGGHIPRTTSGKIRRFACRDLVMQGLPAAAPVQQSA